MTQPTLQRIKDAVRAVIPVDEDQITVDRDLKDLGADSIDRVEIISHLRHSMGITAPLVEFAKIPDIGALVRFCEQNGAMVR